MSRHIFVFATEKRQLVAYPGEMSDAAKKERFYRENRLIADLTDMAALSGPFQLTPDAVKWGTEWYAAHWEKYGKESRERLGFPARKQTHLHKLGMVISAARGDFPAITREHLIEANSRLEAVEPGIKRVLTLVGTTNITRAGREIIEYMELESKATLKRDLYGKYFFRRLSMSEFDEALQGAIGAGYIGESTDRTILTLKKRLET